MLVVNASMIAFIQEETFTEKPRHGACTGANHTHCIHIALVRKKFNSAGLFVRTVTLWSTLQNGCFVVYYNISYFKFRMNRYLSYKYLENKIITSVKQTQSVNMKLLRSGWGAENTLSDQEANKIFRHLTIFWKWVVPIVFQHVLNQCGKKKLNS